MPERHQSPITTILFTDLVGSTELMGRVGDERAQGLFAAHHKLLADAVSAHGGSELQWLGDGLMVAFTSTADAVRCAVTMQQAAAQQLDQDRLEIRVGLNAAEVLRQEIGAGSGYFGTPVVVARRLCDRAEAGQIVCAATISIGATPRIQTSPGSCSTLASDARSRASRRTSSRMPTRLRSQGTLLHASGS